MPDDYDLYVSAAVFGSARAIGSRKPMIVLDSNLLELLGPGEQRVVLAHELGHILSDHVLYMTALDILLRGASNLPVIVGLPLRAVRAVLLEWMRAAELSLRPSGDAGRARPADRVPHADGASPAASPPTSSTSTRSWPRRCSTRTGLTPTIVCAGSSSRSAPPTPHSVRRVSEVMRWVQSGEYDRIIRGEYRRRGDDKDVREEAGDAMEFYADRFRALFRELGENVTTLGSQVGDVSQQVADWLRTRGAGVRAAAGPTAPSGAPRRHAAAGPTRPGSPDRAECRAVRTRPRTAARRQRDDLTKRLSRYIVDASLYIETRRNPTCPVMQLHKIGPGEAPRAERDTGTVRDVPRAVTSPLPGARRVRAPRPQGRAAAAAGAAAWAFSRAHGRHGRPTPEELEELIERCAACAAVRGAAARWAAARGAVAPVADAVGGRGRARRGDVRLALLRLLAEEPRNGYQLMQTIEERSDGRWRPSPGSVYPTLAQLEDEGLVRSTESDGARHFEITDAGREHLETRADEPAPWDTGEEGPSAR